MEWIIDKLFWFIKWSLSGWGIIAIQQLYRRVSRFNIFVNHLRWWLLNRSMYWSATVEYDGKFASNELNKIQRMMEQDFERYKLRSQSNEYILFDVEGFLVTIALDKPITLTTEETYYTLYIEFSNIRTPFREAEDLLNRFAAILTKIEKHLSLISTKYGTNIEFEKINPYFGLYANKLKSTDIEHFTCVFHVPHAKEVDSTVHIYKNAVEIVSPQMQAFQTLTRKYLALSAV